FSAQMLNWGEETLKPSLNNTHAGRLIYAGGDNFLGVFYRRSENPCLQPIDCLNWFYRFKSDDPDAIWTQHQQPITVSVGFVWAAPNVPQRDALQHCREAEKSAKTNGRDRLALRILFNNGNHLEWVCPWRCLPLLQQYRDHKGGQNWTHLFNDIAKLQSRHAFANDQADVAIALFKLYFGEDNNTLDPENWWNCIKTLENGKAHPVSGILGECDHYPTNEAKHKALNDWVINLAKVGFYLHQQHTDLAIPHPQAASVKHEHVQP
ncbi:MAG: hypothetical protein WCD18_24185, partial [Thermosynechococcaceae cyanobacterium]